MADIDTEALARVLSSLREARLYLQQRAQKCRDDARSPAEQAMSSTQLHAAAAGYARAADVIRDLIVAALRQEGTK